MTECSKPKTAAHAGKSKRTRIVHYYHRTSIEAAEGILRNGFKNGRGKYMTDRVWSGVWLSDRPLDVGEGGVFSGPRTVLLHIHIDATKVEPHEWIEEDRPYREFLVPAKTLNRYGKVRIERTESLSEYQMPLPKSSRPLTEAHRELIKLLARAAIEDYLKDEEEGP